jgi:hypothetical protein
MVSDAPEDLRVPCVAAAWAVDGLLGIAPAAVAASQPEDDRRDLITVTRESSSDDLDELKRKFQDDERKRREQFEADLKASEAARLAAKRKEKAEKDLNSCAQAFLAAVSKLETEQGKEDADLLAEVSKNVSALQAWVAQQQALEGSAGKPPPTPAPKGAASSSAAEQSTASTGAAPTSQTADDSGKKK